jgi:hypothetical protein
MFSKGALIPEILKPIILASGLALLVFSYFIMQIKKNEF